MKSSLILLSFILIANNSFAQYKKYLQAVVDMPLDSFQKHVDEPLNNKFKKAKAIDKGQIKVFSNDEIFTTSYIDNYNQNIKHQDKNRLFEYLLTTDQKLVKLNYRNLKQFIPSGSSAYTSLQKAKHHRLRKIIYYHFIGAGIIVMINNIGLNKYLFIERASSFHDGMIGTSILLSGMIATIGSKKKNNLLL